MAKILFLVMMVIPCSLIFSQSEVSRPRVGLVLSGGGAKAVAHIPLLKALDELNIEIDYIAGTSMGSFIGALYAIGYNAERIEKIFFQEDWDGIMFHDQISRRSLAMHEKYNDGRYISTFPFKDWKIDLPSGINPGQSLSSTIAHYAWPVNHRDDFSKFPTPFLCIATDIETGEDIVLENGFLPDAIVASMAFPSVVSPVEIDGCLLVDGGLVRNFPVQDLKERGVDLVIGVDVGARLYEKDELNTVIKVLEQISSYSGAKSTAEQRSLCDILITPDISGYDAGSFNALDTLYQRGVDALEKVRPELEALANSQKAYSDSKTKFIPLEKYNPINVTSIQAQGLENVSERLFQSSLRLTEHSSISPADLEKAIERLYGSQYFERVNYKFDPDTSGVKLIIRVKEKTIDQFKFGVHYDSDMRAAVLLNTTFRNKMIEGSTFSLNLRLSSNPTISGSYYIYSGWKPGLGVGLNFTYQNFEVPLRDPSSTVLNALMDYSSYNSNLWIYTILSSSYAIGAAIEHSYSKIIPIFLSASMENYGDDDNMNPSLLNFFLYAGSDTYDRAVFPSEGVKFYSEFKVFTDEFIVSEDQSHPHFNRAFLSLNHVLKFSETVSWFYSISAGIVNRIHLSNVEPFIHTTSIDYVEVPSDNLFWVGGSYAGVSNIFPFTGANFMEYSAKDVKVFRSGLQIEPKKDRFIVLHANKAYLKEQYTFDEQQNAYIAKDIDLAGYGLTLGMITPIGPMEYTIMGNSETSNMLTHLSIGYYF